MDTSNNDKKYARKSRPKASFNSSCSYRKGRLRIDQCNLPLRVKMLSGEH